MDTLMMKMKVDNFFVLKYISDTVVMYENFFNFEFPSNFLSVFLLFTRITILCSKISMMN